MIVKEVESVDDNIAEGDAGDDLGEGGKVCEQDVVQSVLVVLVLSKTRVECPIVAKDEFFKVLMLRKELRWQL